MRLDNDSYRIYLTVPRTILKPAGRSKKGDEMDNNFLWVSAPKSSEAPKLFVVVSSWVIPNWTE